MDHKDVCFEIENDDFYRQFFNNALKRADDKKLSAAEKIEHLNKGIDKLNLELETQVLSKHHDLLTQASHTTNMEKNIGILQLDAQGLLSGIEKLRAQVLTPYDMLEKQTEILGRIQKVCHLMRQALKIIEYCKRLKDLDKNPSLQATLTYEVEKIIEEGDFEGINFLIDELQMVKSFKSTITDGALKNLHHGLLNSDKSLIIQSFNIFNNLHCAKAIINDLLASELSIVTQNIQNAFNIQQNDLRKASDVKPGPGKANVMNSQIFKQYLWENIERLFNESLHVSCKKIILLQNCLNDLHTLENYRNIAKGFWNKFSNIFAEELRKSSITVNQCVEIDFPRLLKCYNELCNKLRYKQFALKRETLSVWENIFLSKSLGKLLDPVRSMWQLGKISNLEQVDEIVRAISSALSVALGDKQLSLALATSVAKCIKQMSTEAEQRICMDSEAGQVIEAPTCSQIKNANLSNVLYYFSQQVNRVLSNMLTVLSMESINIIQESLKDFSSITVLQPFCISIKSAINLILGSMQDEPEVQNNDSNDVKSCSLYIRELQHFLVRCRDSYFSLYGDVFTIEKCWEDISTHCIQIFIYNVCSLRPMSEYRRRKLHFDCRNLASILGLFCHTIEFSDIRSLLGLLDLTPANMSEVQPEQYLLPRSLVILFLFSFAGPDLLSPHQCAGWSQSKLVAWLCEHQNERERIEFIAGALQRYENHVNQSGITKYDNVYPILLRLLEETRKPCI